MRVGIGYDVHKLAAGRKLILGGVEIPYDEGLLGHSDADVLIHAVMDALLGDESLSCADGTKYSASVRDFQRTGQYQSHYGGGTWVYRQERGNILPGNLLPVWLV